MSINYLVIKEFVLCELRALSRNTKDLVWTLFIPLIITFMLGLTFGAEYMRFALPGLIAMTLMFLCMFGLTVDIVWEREIKIYRRLHATPVKLSQIIISKILIFILLGLLQMFVLLFTVGLLWKVDINLHPYLFLAMILTIFVFASLGLVITVFSNDMQSSSNFINALAFPMLYLGGALFPLDAAHFLLQALSVVNPLRYLRNVFYLALYEPGNLPLANIDLIIPLIFGLALLLISLRKFKWDVLS